MTIYIIYIENIKKHTLKKIYVNDLDKFHKIIFKVIRKKSNRVSKFEMVKL